MSSSKRVAKEISAIGVASAMAGVSIIGFSTAAKTFGNAEGTLDITSVLGQFIAFFTLFYPVIRGAMSSDGKAEAAKASEVLKPQESEVRRERPRRSRTPASAPAEHSAPRVGPDVRTPVAINPDGAEAGETVKKISRLREQRDRARRLFIQQRSVARKLSSNLDSARGLWQKQVYRSSILATALFVAGMYLATSVAASIAVTTYDGLRAASAAETAAVMTDDADPAAAPSPGPRAWYMDKAQTLLLLPASLVAGVLGYRYFRRNSGTHGKALHAMTIGMVAAIMTGGFFFLQLTPELIGAVLGFAKAVNNAGGVGLPGTDVGVPYEYWMAIQRLVYIPVLVGIAWFLCWTTAAGKAKAASSRTTYDPRAPQQHAASVGTGRGARMPEREHAARN